MAAHSGKHGVVLSSGGGDGAYAVGVMQALFGGMSPATGYEPIDPMAFGGTSIGAFNASCVISEYDGDSAAAAARLKEIWLEDLAGELRDNGAFRIRGNPFRYFDPRIFASAPIRHLADLARDGGFLTGDWARRAAHLVDGSEPLEQRLLTKKGPG